MRRLLDVVIAQCGLRVDRLTAGWVAGFALSMAVTTLVRAIGHVDVSILYFVATSVFYYGGNAAYLGRRSAGALGLSGESASRAWAKYQAIVGLMFLNQALGFSAVASLSYPGSTLPLDARLATALGWLLVVVGVGVKTWATWIVGVDCYYYRDLFFRRGEWRLSKRGPYAIFANPMYGVGNLHVYGLAILARSIPGLVAALACHAAIYAFHFAVERPFVRESLRRSLAG